MPNSKCRIDKWLWSVRLSKTRSRAVEACNGGHVKLNSTRCKPAHAVKPGDIIDLTRGDQHIRVQVLQELDKRIGAPRVPEFYDDITPEESLEVKASKPQRERGGGRPTKKERRQLDEWLDFGLDPLE